MKGSGRRTLQMKQKKLQRANKYGLTKMLCDERSRQSTTVLDKNGNLISSKTEVKARWTEHVKEVLNREAPVNPKTDDQDDDVHDTLEETAVNKPNLCEVKAALKGLQNGKAPGIDSITAELLKADILFSSEKIYQLMKKIWLYEKIPKS